ncbi:glucan 1,3-beta-glucosidase-like protein [Eremomyces bilateralis CBS 781.70]|uniref:glucan 1,3-beta-glucosidase n=1 Tax=Eremomyces bilateralis CBS 781.70 TaxID=1392243 RepID=A0A6G1GFU8_9PEZI|nr:glucan 1,3-beta-glucosidase-like protein [Eremomyces bilateralis CBS 781.70]KAF1816948.1 glucan 1,3-beta-glucosidase-like protein [Eremomyces bilateralis CBS 781.70]
MHFSTLISVALAAAPAAVSAAGTLGFALGTKNPDGSCKSQSEYESDMDAIVAASGSTLVRGYAASDCNAAQNILPAAKEKGFKVVLGIWPDVEESFTKDTEAVKEYGTKYEDQVYAITVGSETLYRGNFTGAELLEKIQTVKKIMPNTKVGTADSWNKYADGTADDVIRGKPDILLINAFGYWQGQPIDNATHTYFDDMMQAITHIQSVAGDTDSIEIWNGETGWPTDGGSDYGAASAGTDNAATYYSEGVCGMLAWGVNVFYFEAFDEPWKPHTVGDSGNAADETKWGAMGADRKTKFDLKC